MQMKSYIDRRSLLGAGGASLMLAGKAWAQQFPIPTTPAEVPGPPPGTRMTKAYVQSAGRTAYLWGWPLVNSVNRGAAFSKVPEPVCWAVSSRSRLGGMRCSPGAMTG